jgi:S-DNA-T family DNA segregation ATPase FtsK/SpoIIIE
MPPKELGEYNLPSWNYLADAEHGFAESQEQFVREQAVILERALKEFDIDAHVVQIDTGPVITMYEISLAPGIKVSAITALSNDIMRSLKAESVRIVAPVPGKNTVGIEVPNAQKERVRFKELLQLAPESSKKMAIPLFLGKDASGEPLITDLTLMPHCLIAGTTGSGKSVCINTIIMSIIYMQRPDLVKLILFDPKVVEMVMYKDIPHLMCPVIHDSTKATSVMEWACEKMDERYDILAEAGVRNIRDYNKLTTEELIEKLQPSTPEEEAKIPKKLPYIIIVIDELADLMLQATSKECETHIVRLAQKARAVGIHLILATQRPSANVVTGLIKSNMPTRIAFRVQSKMDSRIVLDQNGAECLLGQGDMLFMAAGASKPVRSQGTFIDDKEVRESVKMVRSLAEAQYEPELVQIRANPSADGDMEKDELFDEAVRVVLETKRGSVSLLQRRLTIGYSRASRLIEQMAQTGILGEYKGSQAREVNFTLEEWDAMQAQARTDAQNGMSV